VILDLDGTLVDSKRDIADAQLWALAQVGVDHLRREDLYRYIGRPLEYTFEQLLPVSLHERIPDIARMYAEYFPSHSLLTTTLFPGVEDTLRRLHLAGVRLAVASSKKGGGIKRVTDHFGIDDLFVQLQGSDRLRFKPAPDVINIILAAQGWKLQDTLMVGDTDVDILAGKNAGVATAAVTYGSLSEAELMEFHPDFIIRSFPELARVVGGDMHTTSDRGEQ
jgi:phosphoglycolate phosphatase-like HAD superfamily hydrolase